EAFPQGIRPLADDVRALGMRFGLWVEPEMVNPDSDLYRAHPDWVLHYPGRPRSECRNQLILDFGRPEVVDHILEVLDRLVREIGVDLFKWDMNRYATEPGSVAGRAVWRAHVHGLYRIMDTLRARHPGLDIQSCSGGGGRVDLGILSRCDQAWTSDNTDAITRTRIQDGFSLAYPPRAMECWVTDETNYLTKRTSSLDLRFDVAMRGVLGIGTPLTALAAEELGEYRSHIAFYKTIRPVVQNGDLYRLGTAAESGASLWLIVAPDRRTAVFSLVTVDDAVGRPRGPFLLRGLDPALSYRLTDRHGTESVRFSGAQLMTLGLPDQRRKFGTSSRSYTLLLEAG
ncbi:MAG TPA: alpha-galactosidase, partial [Terrimicrobiaceae bacterium]|nr:alpha-galactosidase [Terrimicrobiaceae bacterium]